MSESRSGEHQELRERFRIAAPSVPAAAQVTFSNLGAAAENESPYQVTISNQTDFNFNVGIVYQMTDGGVQQTDLKPLPSGESVSFDLGHMGQCANLQAYVVWVFYQGEPVVRLPQEGAFTPESIEDQDPCGDRLALVPA
jgi:hypothetical protein